MNQRVKKLLLAILTMAVLLSYGIFYYNSVDGDYYTVDEMYGFPVPKNAQLEVEGHYSKHYTWSKAGGDKGIPLSYKLVIRKKGWKKGNVEGTVMTYTKGDKVIYLSTSTQYLEVFK